MAKSSNQLIRNEIKQHAVTIAKAETLLNKFQNSASFPAGIFESSKLAARKTLL
jgi:hypothetical protein